MALLFFPQALSMAPTFVTLPKPFFLNRPSLSLSQRIQTQRLPCFKRNSLTINAISKTWEPTKVTPQADRVLIRLQELPEKSAGGVLLPISAVKSERYLMGEILSVGTEVGGVEAGNKVLFSDINAYEGSGTGTVQVDLGTDGRQCFCKASDLLAVVQ